MPDHSRPNQAAVVIILAVLITLGAIAVKMWIDRQNEAEEAQRKFNEAYWRTAHQLEKTCTHDSLTRARDSLGLHGQPLPDSTSSPVSSPK